ncbi:glycosyltransferase [Rhizobium sp. CNPSo 3968]|uniref:glycosyltransferase n=1 Tax=Rhizobium sp. CNPSo 3968 TaxID=3021408 RepID=UPI00254C42FA|nr:glycosyltransferase [Rhizobium sp. CNPSo 3968]MDK4724014.1 glycosyltransferase [Rhizobium sp. CNPSo 3968]
MHDIILDMTPTAINRTAIFHIALDTAKALTGKVRGFRYMTSDFTDPISDSEKLNTMRGEVLNAILGDQGLINSVWRPDKKNEEMTTRRTSKIFYFDPLYVLFDELRSDDIVLILDLTPVTNPEWHNPRVCELYRAALQRVASSGARVASISYNTAQALWANFGIPYDKVIVVPLYLRDGVGANSQDFGDERPVSKTLLFVGSLESRKNLKGLFRGFEASGLAGEGYKLAVAGGSGAGADEIRAVGKNVEGVEILGFVSDEDLRELYRTANAFVYPSYLEGFGVPILEAASWGLPIMTSITGATSEVSPAGSILVDPYNVTSISRGLRRITALGAEERMSAAAVNREHASRFNFPRYMKVIEHLLSPLDKATLTPDE